jgi:hypothetical protein
MIRSGTRFQHPPLRGPGRLSGSAPITVMIGWLPPTKLEVAVGLAALADARPAHVDILASSEAAGAVHPWHDLRFEKLRGQDFAHLPGICFHAGAVSLYWAQPADAILRVGTAEGDLRLQTPLCLPPGHCPSG